VRLLTLHPNGASEAGANHASWYILWYLSVHDTHADMMADFVCFFDLFESSVFCKYDCTLHCMLHDDSPDINTLSGPGQSIIGTLCLMQWTRSAQALQEEGVKVMTINPAQVNSPMTRSRPDSEYIPDLLIQPQEIADLCVFAFKVGSPCIF